MSLNTNKELRQIAKATCRDLRKNQTNAEKIFWEQVRNRKFMGLKINRQFPIFYDLLGKESFYVTDIYCHEKNSYRIRWQKTRKAKRGGYNKNGNITRPRIKSNQI